MWVVRVTLERMDTIPIPTPTLPYAGTSGHSGSNASRERAETDDKGGTTAKRQSQALELLTKFGSHGMTVVEFRNYMSFHHGQASSVLSVLHKGGRIARLADMRGAGEGRRCHVYVLPENVNGRETQSPGRNAPKADDRYDEGYAEGCADLARRVRSVLNRHPLQAETRLGADLLRLLNGGPCE